MDEKTDYEKAIEGVNRLALLVSEYYKALLAQGIPEAIATTLAAKYQETIFTMNNRNDPPKQEK